MNRRTFLKHASATTLSMPLWMRLCNMNAEAQTVSGYKAMLCITLVGGNDANNLLVPADNETYQEYASIRNVLALPQSSLLPIATKSGTYGLHPAMQNFQSRFSAGQASIVANVGPILKPATKQDIQSGLVPSSMLNHPDSQSAWESGMSSPSPVGWGGQIGDVFAGYAGALPTVISVSGDSTFTIGNTGQRMTMSSASTLGAQPLPSDLIDIVQSIAAGEASSSQTIVAAAAKLRSQAFQQQQTIAAAQATAKLQTVFPTTSLGQSLLSIAQVIAGRGVVGASRQVFYAQQSGYDTHTNQLGTQALLLSQLDGAVGAFMNAMDELGLTNQVLVCTLSDFGRTLQSNVQAGTDHAWGSHQMILGGGIQGGRVIGSVPPPELGGSTDLYSQGVWIPTIAASQMTAGIASWFGLSSQQVQSIFPNLANFADGAIPL